MSYGIHPFLFWRVFITRYLKANGKRLSTVRGRFFSGLTRTNLDLRVYALAELIEDGHQSVNGETVKLYVANAGKVRMIHTGTALGPAG